MKRGARANPLFYVVDPERSYKTYPAASLDVARKRAGKLLLHSRGPVEIRQAVPGDPFGKRVESVGGNPRGTRANPSGPKLGVYTLTMKQGTALPTRFGIFTGLTNARRAAGQQADTRFIGEVLDSTKRRVGYVVPAPGFSKEDLTRLVETHIGNPPKVFYKDVDGKGRERFYHDANMGRRLTLYPVEEAKLLIATGAARVVQKKGNPGAPGSSFARCVSEVSEKGSTYDPRAVCAATGRKKYGAKKFQAMAQAGKKRAGNPRHDWDSIVPVSDPSEAGRLLAELVNRVRLHPDHEYFMRFVRAWGKAHGVVPSLAEPKIAEGFHAGYKATYKRNPDADSPRAFVSPQRKDGLYPVQFVYPTTGARVKKLLSAADLEKLKAEGRYLVIGASGRRNPAAAAAEVYEEFHGTPSTELVTVTEPVHYHAHLAGLGKLAYLKVAGVDGYMHTLKDFAGSLLCSNEDRNQLFVEGGDQAVDLGVFGISAPHEVETLGQVTEIGYRTTKHHLGAEGGKALYFHLTGEDGGSSPDLLYRVRDAKLEFSGGSYSIKSEGIEN